MGDWGVEVSGAVIGAAMEVHRQLGPGLLESVYRNCLVEELRWRGLLVEQEVKVPIIWRERRLDQYFRLDLLVEDTLIVELKSVETLHPVHSAQLLSYLRLTNKPVGLLLNFNTAILKDGIRRLVL